MEGVKFSKNSNCAPTYSTIPMRWGVHVVTKIHRCGGAVRAYSRAIAVFRFFDPIFRLWVTFTRPFGSSDRPPKLPKIPKKALSLAITGKRLVRSALATR